MKELLTCSDNMKQEYCCTVVKIGEVKPIEGSDFLGQTLVNGISIVVRKDEVHPGDIMFYAANECQLNNDFLGVNNQFEISSREKNENYKEVQALIDEGKVDDAKKLVGFFNKHGRVRMIKLRGCPSMGFLFSKETMANWCPLIVTMDLDEYVNTDFDTVNGELFVRAYVPPVKEVKYHLSGNTNKRNKKMKKYDRMIPGQFSFHYDTKQFSRYVDMFKPTDVVSISVKLHGTSFILGNVKVKKPIIPNFHIGFINRLFNKLYLHLPSWMQRYTEEYDAVYSSRNVIKNQYINENQSNGYYNVDVWNKFYEIMKDYVPEGMTIYGEIVGYVTGSNTMIQKGYDYGCMPGENKLMIYRINTEYDNKKHEWDIPDVIDWVNDLVSTHPELESAIHKMDLVYHGQLGALYTDLDTENDWGENILERMKNDYIHFGMEQNESLCRNTVPREGIVIRIDGDSVDEAFKLKTISFALREAKEMDNGNIDIEMTQAYGEQ